MSGYIENKKITIEYFVLFSVLSLLLYVNIFEIYPAV